MRSTSMNADWTVIGPLIDRVLAEEGSGVELIGDNPDPSPSVPDSCVGFSGLHTQYQRRDYRGETVEACLTAIIADQDNAPIGRR